MLAKKIKKVGDVEVIIKAGKEHRFVVVFRGKGLEGPLTSTDPNREGFKLLEAKPEDPESVGQKKTAKAVAEFVKLALPIIASHPKAKRLPHARHCPSAPHPAVRGSFQAQARLPGRLSDVQGPGPARRHDED